MSYKSKFFRSVEGDRVYTASDWADYFKSIVQDGVTYDNEDGLEVYCNGSDMKSRIKVGGIIIQGYNYEQSNEIELEHDTETSGNNRIDRVVLRLNTNTGDPNGRMIKLDILKGDPAIEPEPLSLTQDLENQGIFEYSLAQILVETGAAQISSANVTKESEKAKLANSKYRQIFIGTGEPNNEEGDEGDIYIQYEEGEE